MFNNQNYFELFKIKQDFLIDKQILYENFIELQKLFHPDKQINKSNVEKSVAIKLSQVANKAYDILNDDKKRAEYLLFLTGIVINQEEGNNIEADPLMLLEILEISENPQDYNLDSLIEESWDNFKDNFANKDFTKAAQAIIKLQYLNKID